MPEALKDLFLTVESLQHMAECFEQRHPGFNKLEFLEDVLDDLWKTLELKEKMRHVTLCLHKQLPENLSEALEILGDVLPSISGFDVMVFPDYVEVYGIDEVETSLSALKKFTKYASAEFAIRPFLARMPGRTLAEVSKWAEDQDDQVRRLASEGCRPRLPWSMALPAFKKDPRPILPILETLKNDESEFVRRSVANNLNDISKDNPEVTLAICERWKGSSENTDWIVKHACRTLLKQGNKRAMILFGYEDPVNISIDQFTLSAKNLQIGESISFSLSLSVERKTAVRLEYAVHYVKANGRASKKVFKISEKKVSPGTHIFQKKHPFADRSTRTHYSGEHTICLIVNGQVKAESSFQLI